MRSTRKDQITHFSRFQGGQPMISYFSILVLASLFYLGTPQSALAIPLLFSENLGIFVAQQQNPNQVPSGIVNAVRQDLSRRTKIASEQLKLKAASRQTWPDGCLGLATSEEICSQVLVEGWQVVMSHQKQTWVYRTDSQGRVLRLEN